MSNLAAQQHAYSQLNDKNVHWIRLDAKHIMVYMSSDGNGSHIPDLDIVKDYLEKMGFRETDRDFDRICGKGFSVFKQLN